MENKNNNENIDTNNIAEKQLCGPLQNGENENCDKMDVPDSVPIGTKNVGSSNSVPILGNNTDSKNYVPEKEMVQNKTDGLCSERNDLLNLHQYNIK